MTESAADDGEHVGPGRPEPLRESLDEQVRRRGIKPIQSVDEMACFEIFESDEELDEFLAFVRAQRQADVA